MDFNLKEAIAKRKILPFPDGPKIASKELQTAKEDLKDAQDVLVLKKYKMATVSSYYAMFHVSRALLYLKGYREKSHIQLAQAIKALYVDLGLLSQEYYDNFLQALSLRELADYKSRFSEDGAKRNIKVAESAIVEAEKILAGR